MRSLGAPLGPVWREALPAAVSFDGSVIAGTWYDQARYATQAFVRSPDGVMRPLGFLTIAPPRIWCIYCTPVGPDPSPFSEAIAISPDGAIVVGTSGLVRLVRGPGPGPARPGNPARVGEAFRWSEVAGMQSIAALLRGAGVNLGATTLGVATGVTTTGAGGTNIIVGYTEDLERERFTSWIVRLPDPRSGTGAAGFTTPEALLGSLGQIPSAAATAERLVWSAQREALLLAEHYGGTLSAEHPFAGFVQARGGGWDPPDE
ncbi:hypothetical protein [Roseomonas rosulenta]|uniref:hypothetical protein n=1 Tax=Roseomonas rosulenta TaxID=2748667 RepID=UPI0018DFC1CB|nr:hypothetical protein [Roseomonas rosulenta]